MNNLCGGCQSWGENPTLNLNGECSICGRSKQEIFSASGIINMNKVIPNLEHTPERVYKRSGKKVTCYPVVGITEGIDRDVKESDQSLFTIELPSEEEAKQIMLDLYYGQYSGA